MKNACGAANDGLEFVVGVVVEPGHQTEAVAQWAGDHARAGGGTDQREARQREPDTGRRGTLTDDDVEHEVFHRGVENLLHRP